jgi:hypothetical protein
MLLRAGSCVRGPSSSCSARQSGRSGALAVAARRRALPHNLFGFVDLETGLLQVRDHPRGELLAGIVRRVLLEDPAQQLPAARHCKPIEKASWSRNER